MSKLGTDKTNRVEKDQGLDLSIKFCLWKQYNEKEYASSCSSESLISVMNKKKACWCNFKKAKPYILFSAQTVKSSWKSSYAAHQVCWCKHTKQNKIESWIWFKSLCELSDKIVMSITEKLQCFESYDTKQNV